MRTGRWWVGEYADTASANDLRGRIAWRRLLDGAAKRRFDAVLVFKLDRVSVRPTHVPDIRRLGAIGHRIPLGPRRLRHHTLGRLLLNLLASLAEFELELIRERVTVGMKRAKAQGIAIGRPKRTDDRTFLAAWAAIRPQILSGRLAQRAAAVQLGCGARTV